MSVRLGGRESKVSRSEAKGILTQSEGKPIQCSSHLERLAKQQFDCGWWCFQHRSSCPSEITHALFQDDQNQLESLLVTDKELQLPEVRMVNLVSLRFPNKCISSQPLLLSGGPPDCSTMSATSKWRASGCWDICEAAWKTGKRGKANFEEVRFQCLAINKIL